MFGLVVKISVHRNGVGIPRHSFLTFLTFGAKTTLQEKILSCFIDEAGDFGEYESHSPYYIVSVIAHKQNNFPLNSLQH